MPKPLPTIDPKAFSVRLNAALDGRPDLYPPGRGRGKAVADAFKVSGPTAHAWLNGIHMPSVDRVLALALELETDFMSMYFGDSLRPARAAGSNSHAARLDLEKLADLIETVEGALVKAQRKVPAPIKAELLIALYRDEQAAKEATPDRVLRALAQIMGKREDRESATER